MYLMVISQLIGSTCLTEIRNKSVNLLLKKFDNLRKIFLKIITKNKNKKKRNKWNCFYFKCSLGSSGALWLFIGRIFLFLLQCMCNGSQHLRGKLTSTFFFDHLFLFFQPFVHVVAVCALGRQGLEVGLDIW